ncbi:uncharacterized protein FA14DRAFT_162531 [Meira miltonrushii]|uniref:Uncharacterized protein n=1 Tax=Meira miltonrushii TaxID=1280837 RepID=A0A316V1T4_9BASI|nr:uncharacterized protein FA14DRAFT_162531 [Meira miltonrushii]PWN31509.1 hypothetical protein FA14DRAFT_162531 [Meira miltonrushii]
MLCVKIVLEANSSQHYLNGRTRDMKAYETKIISIPFSLDNFYDVCAKKKTGK